MTRIAEDSARQFLRHTVATVAYRAGKALRGAPESFAEFRCGETTRTPAKILAHMGDLLDWAISIARGKEQWHDSQPLAWNAEVARFFASVKRFDEYLGSHEIVLEPLEMLFQGPVADALSHVGQIAMLRRLSATPIRGENYAKAEIVAGRCGWEQAAPRREFE